MKRTKNVNNKEKKQRKPYQRNKGGEGSGRGGSLYNADKHPRMVYRFGLLGLTDTQMAAAFDVSPATIDNWKKKHKKFREMMIKGKQQADAKVATALFQKAIGYSHPDVHISNYKGMITETEITKHYPPDTAAAIFWLKNRTRQLDQPWNDVFKHEMSGPGGGAIDINATIDTKGMDPEEIIKLCELGLKIQDSKKTE